MATITTIKTEKRIGNWLLFVMLLVVAMIVMGGATRLTNSGLSITEWRPITGALPPLSDAQWMEEFNKYKQIPEFLAEHPDMDLSGFKFIYFMEWAHRQLGRIIGLAYALPFFWWAVQKKLPAGKGIWFLAILLLIGVQGAIGWWMVASGLVNDRVDVSHHRLATHLAIAFLILGMLFSAWRNQVKSWPVKDKSSRLRRHAGIVVVLVYLQIILGAFVAGTHAGRTYNTWPLMDGKFFPAGYADMTPFWLNLAENIAAIQFNHRFLAYVIFAACLSLLWRARRIRRQFSDALVLMAIVTAQIGLGIWTLLMVTPLNLALLHQFTAVLLFLAALAMRRSALYSR